VKDPIHGLAAGSVGLLGITDLDEHVSMLALDNAA
jgi:hypothetical protein